MKTDEASLPKEPEVIANELSNRLHEFFASGKTPEQMDKMLPDLARYIISEVTIDALKLKVDKEFQAKLDEAVSTTLTTPLKNPLGDKPPTNPWKGPHSIVVINLGGMILGASFEPSEQLASYGDVSRFALVKAVYEGYLYRAGMEGGLNNLINIKHLIRDRGEGETKLGLFEHVFIGSTPPQSSLRERGFIIGSSGAIVKDDYISDVLSGATAGPETLAGAFDTAFCILVGNRLTHRPSDISLIEPNIIQEIRTHN